MALTDRAIRLSIHFALYARLYDLGKIWKYNESTLVQADCKNELQICGAGRESRNRPMLIVGNKTNGKSQ
jgi:hypothetical protein